LPIWLHTNQNDLRGIQESDATGKVTFTSIYPACYAGRWPHNHFEVYPSLATAVSAANKIATTTSSATCVPRAADDERQRGGRVTAAITVAV
jgi:protocatechuate 3,4-dioxygenase beta subunit